METRPQFNTTFFMFNSTEHEPNPAHKRSHANMINTQNIINRMGGLKAILLFQLFNTLGAAVTYAQLRLELLIFIITDASKHY